MTGFQIEIDLLEQVIEKEFIQTQLGASIDITNTTYDVWKWRMYDSLSKVQGQFRSAQRCENLFTSYSVVGSYFLTLQG